MEIFQIEIQMHVLCPFVYPNIHNFDLKFCKFLSHAFVQDKCMRMRLKKFLQHKIYNCNNFTYDKWFFKLSLEIVPWRAT